MAKIIRVDFKARTVTEVRDDDPTDDVRASIAELLRRTDADQSAWNARGAAPPDTETCCPICRSDACALWLELGAPGPALER